MSEKDEEDLFAPGEEQAYRKWEQPSTFPITNEEQLGQDILKTFARTSDPNTIIHKKVRKMVPVFSTKTVLNKKGKEIDVEYLEGYEIKEWTIPITIQPKYHDLITDDIARAFFSDGDLEVFRIVSSYCKTIKSFADRYGLDLSLHYNNMADENNILSVSSGAYKGKRVQLAKTNIAESSSRQNLIQSFEQQNLGKNKKGFLDFITKP